MHSTKTFALLSVNKPDNFTLDRQGVLLNAAKYTKHCKIMPLLFIYTITANLNFIIRHSIARFKTTNLKYLGSSYIMLKCYLLKGTINANQN